MPWLCSSAAAQNVSVCTTTVRSGPESGEATRHGTKPEAVALVENFGGPFVGRTAAPMAWSFVNPQLKRLRDRVRAEHRDIPAEVDVHELVHIEALIWFALYGARLTACAPAPSVTFSSR
jgi:hypothetical protein